MSEVYACGVCAAAHGIPIYRARRFLPLKSSISHMTALPWKLRCRRVVCVQLLHEGIAKFNGYEINTEGDSFHIAFTSVAAAVQVAMETQVRLLDSDWPKDVLKLPACGQVTPLHPCPSLLLTPAPLPL